MPPRLLLLAAAVLFSTGGVAIKYNDLSGWQVASSRSILAAGALWFMLPGVRRPWNLALFGIACAYAAMLIFFVTATKLTTAANAIFLQSTAPIYLLFISPVFLREPVRRSDFLLMGAMAIGMSLFFVSTEPAANTAPNPALGNLLGAGSGISWAIVVAGLRYMGRHDPSGSASITVVFAGNLIGFLVAAAPAFPFPALRATDVLSIVYLGFFQIALAYWCLTKAIRHVPAFEAATVLLVEPALNPVWTWLVLDEKPGLLACVGGGVLLVATAFNAWWQNRDALRSVRQ